MAKRDAVIFSGDTIEFLKALKKNNDRVWFNANKDRYEAAFKRPAEIFCDEMTTRLEGLTGVAHVAKVYRIHRDVRFSKDKTPYNTYLHISFSPPNAAAAPPAWFFGVDPQGVAVGAGSVGFDKQGLESFRERAGGDDGKTLIRLLDRLRQDGLRISEPELKRVPVPFASDHPRAALLRRKSLSAWLDIDDPYGVTRPGLVALCEKNFRRLKPLVSWLRGA